MKTVNEVADICNVTRQRIHQLIIEHNLHVIKYPRQVLIPVKTEQRLQEMLERHIK